ncbi:MAG: hypothetical protein HYU76_15050 [Betaproteobacteria bacterium]|nr:hypothetical protein [Betaproteobacteria bacterium]
MKHTLRCHGFGGTGQPVVAENRGGANTFIRPEIAKWANLVERAGVRADGMQEAPGRRVQRCKIPA